MNNTQLKYAVRYLYDLQKLRIQTGNRNSKHAEHAEAALSDDDKAFLTRTSKGLNALEREALKEVERLLQSHPLYKDWLEKQRGIGPTMAGLIISEFDITKCDTPSKMWAWAGLAVRNGKADRLVKGQKARYNPWLKSKMVEVLGGCLMKAASLEEETGRYYIKRRSGKKDTSEYKEWKEYFNYKPWRAFFDNYKHRKKSQQVDVCMNCDGSGKYKPKVKKGEEPKKASKCTNCNGTGGPAPWGCSDAHRKNAAQRYMVKQFLLALWKVWRELEGLPVRKSYAEEYLGITHHGEPIGDFTNTPPTDQPTA
jgi:hypothetical protein